MADITPLSPMYSFMRDCLFCFNSAQEEDDECAANQPADNRLVYVSDDDSNLCHQSVQHLFLANAGIHFMPHV